MRKKTGEWMFDAGARRTPRKGACAPRNREERRRKGESGGAFGSLIFAYFRLAVEGGGRKGEDGRWQQKPKEAPNWVGLYRFVPLNSALYRLVPLGEKNIS